MQGKILALRSSHHQLYHFPSSGSFLCVFRSGAYYNEHNKITLRENLTTHAYCLAPADLLTRKIKLRCIKVQF
jgi:hypothetical protein